MVRSPKHVATGPADDIGVGGQNPWAAERSTYHARRTELDLYGHYGHDRLEFSASRPVPAPISTGFASGQSIPQFLVSRKDPEIL